MKSILDLDPAALRHVPAMRSEFGERLIRRYERIDNAIVQFLRANGVTVLRWALGLVFIWFGALKLVDRSPVAGLVAETVYWLPADAFVRFLGGWEVLIGLGLIAGVGLRLVLLLFALQMAGTFLVFVTRPGEAFQGNNPLLLTTIGEFVIKNLVLIAAGLVVGSTVRDREEIEREAARHAY